MLAAVLYDTFEPHPTVHSVGGCAALAVQAVTAIHNLIVDVSGCAATV